VLQIIFRGMFLLLLSIALYSGLKSQPVPQVISHFDLMLHFGVFFAMSVFWQAGFPRRWQLFGMIFLLLLGVSIEFWQGWWLPGRTASMIDVLANSLGVASGWRVGTLVRSGVGYFSLK